MQPDNKHKIFSKEELFKLIDEKKSLPTEADDFDAEAMEGLAMLTNRNKTDGLNNSIDEVLRREKAKAAKRRNIYFLSAAASLVLIISFFFLMKNNSFEKKENELAENTKPLNDITKVDEPKALEESPAAEKKLPEGNVNTPVTTATGEASGKEGKKSEFEVSAKSNQSVATGDVMAIPPTEVAADVQTKTANRKLAGEKSEADNDERNKGGKDYKTSLAKDDQLKREETKKADVKLEDKEKEKDKTRYVTTTPASGVAVADESKNKSADDRSQNQLSQNGSGSTTNNNNALSAPQKNAEMVVNEKQTSKGPEKKAKSTKEQIIKPDSAVTDMLAGYSYYDQKPGKGNAQGGETQKIQQPSSPAQTQNEVTTSSTIAQKERLDSANEQKYSQEVADKKSGKHEAQPDNNIATLQMVDSQPAIRGISNLKPAEFSGGNEALQQYVKKNLKISSPKQSGTIVAEFVVNKDGKIDTGSVKITTKIKNCDACSSDITKLVKAMPKWKPATENGKAANGKQKLSIKYNSIPATK